MDESALIRHHDMVDAVILHIALAANIACLFQLFQGNCHSRRGNLQFFCDHRLGTVRFLGPGLTFHGEKAYNLYS